MSAERLEVIDRVVQRGITVGGAGLFVTLYALPDAIPSGARRPSQPAPMLPP